MTLVPEFVAGSYVGYRIFNDALLFRFAARARGPENQKPLSSWPGVSILLPIKGRVENLEESLVPLLTQNYPGSIELIFGIRDETDPVIAQAREVIAKTQSRTVVKWAVGGEAPGLNPKNSNLAQAFTRAAHPWIYCCDVDTRLETDHLRNMISLSRNDPKRHVTSITVHEGPRDIGSALEVIGTNVEAIGFFIVRSLNQRAGIVNGASNLFHRELLSKVGGFTTVVNALTEDLLFGKLFSKAGATMVLAKRFVRVTQERQSFHAFSQRQIRWLMIARYFRPEFFWLAPLNWVGQWIFLLGVLFACMGQESGARFMGLGAAVLLFRVLEAAFTEIVTQTPKQDWFKAPVLLFYDIWGPYLWACSVFRSEVVWNGNILRVKRGGFLERAN